ncbi:hypothetical protein IQ238_26240 [Pleurocapsales cyanobacterium LEGE 06147]|nr:hypothetical protein [Pleurocapsales cyanobacterium LEGE 06147]
MMTTSKYCQTSSRIGHDDWCFLPSMLSGTLGIIIGLVIAFQLGWV